MEEMSGPEKHQLAHDITKTERGKGHDGRKKLHHIEVHPAHNGHIVHAHYHRPTKDGADHPMGGDYANHEEKHIVKTGQEAGDKVRSLLEPNEGGDGDID